MPTTGDYLKYANLQMAAEAFIRNEKTGVFAGSGQLLIDVLKDGNNHASRFTEVQAKAFADQWEAVDQRANTSSGFSGTLFRNKANPEELVVSFRSTEFIDDAARDNEATNTQEILKFGFAFGQLADMEAWYQELIGTDPATGLAGPLAGKTFAVTGYSLGGHLATAFNLMHPGAAGQVVTFNGAGVGRIGEGSLGEMQAGLPQMIAEFQRLRALDAERGLEGEFSTIEAQSAYRAIRAAIAANGGVPTAAMQNLTPVLTDEFAFDAKVELQQLSSALGAALAVAGEAVRVPALSSGPDANGSVSSPTPVNLPEIDGASLDYQLAVRRAAASFGAAPLHLLAGGANIWFGKTFGDGGPLANQWDVVGTETTTTPTGMVANSQYHYGNHASLFIEDQPLYRSSEPALQTLLTFANAGGKLLLPDYARNDFGDTHSLVLIVDSLNMQSLLQTLAPESSQAAIESIFRQGSNLRADSSFGTQGKAEGDALENVLNALGVLLLGPEAWEALRGDPEGNSWHRIDDLTRGDDELGSVTYSGRDSFYEALAALQASDAFAALSGKLTLAAVDVAAVKEKASTDFAAFATLYALAPFVPGLSAGVGGTLEAIVGEAWGQAYEDWESDRFLSDEERAAGKAAYSEQWYADRGAFLGYWLQSTASNVQIVEDGNAGLNVTDQLVFRQLDSGQKITVQNSVSGETNTDRESRYVLFGGKAMEILNGGKLTDRLYGMAGLDVLDGRQGADHLEGGAGLDLYRFATGDGADTLLDSDRRAALQRNNELLVLAFKTGDGEWRGGEGERAFTATRSGADLVLSFADSEDDRVTLKNFDFAAARTGAGSYGLRLIEALPAAPEPVRTFLGDTATWDSDLTKAGIQAQPDGFGNMKRADGEDGRPLTEQPDRSDIFYGSAGNEAERFITGKGDDVVFGDGPESATAAAGGIDLIAAGAGRDLVFGGAGDDRIEGGADGDILWGNADDDLIHGGSSDNGTLTLAAAIQAGEKAVSVPGQGDVLAGEAGDDTLIGSAGDDALFGGEGRDIVVGGGGDDVLFGDMRLRNATFDWRITREEPEAGEEGEPGEASAYRLTFDGIAYDDWNVLDGEADLLIGGAGNDWILGGGGDDLILGGNGNDRLWGDAGSDVILGGEGDDLLVGDSPGRLAGEQEGDDILDGGAGNDRLEGNGGNDVLIGGKGNDVLVGGAGKDVYIYAKGDGSDIIEDIPNDANDPEASVLILNGVKKADVKFRLGSLHVDVGDGEGLHFAGFDPDDPWATPVVGEIRFDDGSLMTYADILAQGFNLDGSDGDDMIVGTAVVDRIDGKGGDDTLIGLAGDDVIVGGTGADTMQGGAGNDTYLLNVGDGAARPSDGAIDTIVDREGGNVVCFGEGILPESVRVRLDSNGRYLVVEYGADDAVAIIDGAVGTVASYVFADGRRLSFAELIGTAAAKPLVGMSATGTRFAMGGSGDDVIDSRLGGALISGGRGDDRIFASGGANTYLYSLGDGTDHIQDVGAKTDASGRPTLNRLRFGDGISADDLRLSVGATGTLDIAVGADANDRIRIAGFNSYRPFDNHGIDLFEFADGTVLTYAELLARGFDFTGGDGNDKLNGTVLADRAFGCAGDDTIATGDGDDFLSGGAGADTLSGGSGSDTYLFSLGDGQDRIEEVAGEAGVVNTVRFGPGIALADLRFTHRADGALHVRVASAADGLTVPGWFLPDGAVRRGIDRFVFDDGSVFATSALDTLAPGAIEGDDGDDVLVGTYKGDTLFGHDGDDILIGGTGPDVLVGGRGHDRYVLEWEFVADYGGGSERGHTDIVIEADGESSTIELQRGMRLDLFRGERLNDDLWFHARGTERGFLIKDYFSTDQHWDIRSWDGSVVAMADFLARPDVNEGDLLGQAWSDFLAQCEYSWRYRYENPSAAGNYQLLDDGRYLRLSEQVLVNVSGTGIKTYSTAYRLADDGNSYYTIVSDGVGSISVKPGAAYVTTTVSYEGFAVQDFADDSNGFMANPGYSSSYRSEAVVFDVLWGVSSYSSGLSSGFYRGTYIAPLTYRQTETGEWVVVEWAETTSYSYSLSGSLSGTIIGSVAAAGSAVTPASIAITLAQAVAATVKAGEWEGSVPLSPSSLVWGTRWTYQTTQYADEYHGGAQGELIYSDDDFAVDGGGGDDLIIPNGGRTSIAYGGDGNDRIFGGMVMDVLNGGAGNDFLAGGGGNDTYLVVRGQLGQDIIDEAFASYAVARPGSPWPWKSPSYAGFDSTDTVRFGAGISLDDLRFSSGSIGSQVANNGYDNTDFATLNISWAAGESIHIVLPNVDDPDTAAEMAANPGRSYGIEYFRFDDGSVVSMAEMMQRAANPAMRISPESIAGLGGIEGTDGNDLLLGLYAGNVISAFGGDDRVHGSNERDIVLGGDGDDILYGAGGDDLIEASDGDDYIDGGAGNDVLRGGSGYDDIEDYSHGGHNLLDGGDDDDFLYTEGNDGDFLIGGRGDDLIYSLSPNNVIAFNRGDGVDRVYLAGSATLSFGGGISLSDLTLAREGDFLRLGLGGNDRLLLKASGWMVPVSSVPLRLQIVGDAGVAWAGLGAAVAEFERMEAAGTAPAVWAVADTLSSGVHEASDGDAVGGRLALDYARLGSLDGLADDEVHALLGDAGFGRWTNENRPPFAVSEVASQQAMQDAPFTLSLAGSFADDDSTDVLTYAARQSTGEPLPTWLSFDPATGVFSGTPAADDLAELALRVTASDPAGADASVEFVLSVVAPTPLELTGTDEADLLTGRAGADILRGQGGDDTLIGGKGDDQLDGGDGDDTYIYTLGDGIDRIIDADGDDRIVLNGILPQQVTLGVGSLKLTFLDGGELHLDDFDPDHPLEGAIETFEFGDGTVMSREELILTLGFHIEGSPANDTLSGTAFGEPLDGHAGNDFLVARGGNDVLDGGEGNDTLDGGAGNDLLLGGAGDDVFLFGRGDGQDVVVDTLGSNSLRLKPGLAATDVELRQSGGDLVVTLKEGSDRMLVEGWFAASGAGWTLALDDGTMFDRAAVEALLIRNEAPVLSDDSLVVAEDGEAVGGNVLANDRDPEGRVLRVVVPGEFAGTYGSLILSADGSYRYTLDNAREAVQALAAGEVVNERFGYAATDDDPANPLSAAAEIVVEIFGANDAPIVVADAAQVGEDAKLTATGNVLANDRDVDAGNVLRVFSPGSFDGVYGSLTLEADGRYAYSLTNDSAAVQSLGRGQQVNDRFSFAVDDGVVRATSSLDVAVTGANDAPEVSVFLADRQLNFHKPFAFQLPEGSFSDIDTGDALDYTATLADGSALPDWLRFDARTQTFSGVAPKAKLALDVRVTATDRVAASGSSEGSLSVSDVFRVSVSHGNEGVGNGEDAAPPGHPGNCNDGPGSSRGNPGARDGHDRRDGRNERHVDDDDDWSQSWGRHGRAKEFAYADLRLIDRQSDDSSGGKGLAQEPATGGDREFHRRWVEMDRTLNRLLAESAAQPGWLDVRRGADVGALNGLGHGLNGSVGKINGVDAVSLVAAGGTVLKGFRGLQEGLQRLG